MNIVSRDEEMRYWLDEDRMRNLDEYVRFVGLRGEIRWSDPRDFDVFKWNGEWYEVQGYDPAGRRWWIERVNETAPRSQVEPKGLRRDPRVAS